MTRQHSTACFILSGVLSAANPKLHHLLQSLHSSPSLTCSPSHSVPPLFLLPFALSLCCPLLPPRHYGGIVSYTLSQPARPLALPLARPECFCSSDTRNYQSRIMKSVAEAAGRPCCCRLPWSLEVDMKRGEEGEPAISQGGGRSGASSSPHPSTSSSFPPHSLTHSPALPTNPNSRPTRSSLPPPHLSRREARRAGSGRESVTFILWQHSTTKA